MSWFEAFVGYLVVAVPLITTAVGGLLYLVPYGLTLALSPLIPGIRMDPQPQDSLASWKGPRKVTLQRWANGFGFTLRHFIVYPPESAVAELNRQQETGGDEPKQRSRISALEPMDTIFVKQVKAEGPAHKAGLANGDRIVSVNGESVTGKTYQQVVNLIQLCDKNLTLFVVPREEDILQVAYPSSAYKASSSAPSTQSWRSDRKQSFPNEQAKREADLNSQNSGSNLSSLSDDHDVLVVGKGGRESEDTESIKERSDIRFLTDDSPSTTYRDIQVHQGSKLNSHTSTSNSDGYRNCKNERKNSDTKQPYKVQRVTASTINHESSAPMRVTVVNTSQSTGDSPSHSQKDQRTFRLTNVLNAQTLNKPQSSQSNVGDVHVRKRDEVNEKPDPQPGKHVASLKSYYEAAKLANSVSSSDANSMAAPAEKAETSKSSSRGHSSSVDNLLTQPGLSSNQAVLRIQPQRSMNGSSSCDDLLTSGARSDIGRQNRQVSIIAGQSVQRTDDASRYSGVVNTWQNDQESVKVSKSPGIGSARITVKVDDPDIHKAFAEEASLHRNEYTAQATRVTVSASVSADNLSQAARNVNVHSGEVISSNVSPKHEVRNRALTVNHESGSRNISSSSSASALPISRSQTLASGRVVHLVGQRQVLPDKPQDSLQYRDKKQSSSSNDISSNQLTVPDGSFFPWKRTGSRRGSAGSEGSEGRPSSNQGKQKPPVPKRDSSRGRVRERSLERERQRERTMHERHRSRSYDRSHQRTNWSQFQAFRKNAGDAVPEGVQMDDGALMRSGRKDSSASSNSAGSVSGEREGKSYPGSSGRQRLVRRTSYLRATGSDGEDDEQGDSGSVTSSQEGERPTREKITPKRNASIRKLKSFFGEGTPKVVEATQPRRPSIIELLGSEPNIKEGPMNIKLASSRSWKPVWAVLKGQVNKLFLMKEERDPSSPLSLLDQPISLNGSNVGIAYEYIKKRRNVIKLTNSIGLTILLQVSDRDTMLAWIKVMQEHNNPSQSEKENSLSQISEKSGKGDSPISSSHLAKAPSPSSYRKKFFKSVSPSGTQSKPRPTAKEEMLAKAKASQSFADRMKRHIRGRVRTSGYTHPLDDNSQASATFGVPLDQCTSSNTNELVPMVVEICCSIVEAKGLEFVGVYRVPGNTAGITYLKEELKKGVDEIDLTDERWQDVNVISSLLKLFFRKLPNPLVPNAQYQAFIAANRLEEPSERMWALRRQIHNLPDHHYETFKFLANHLKVVAANADVNRMEVRNLAIVFGPTLVRSGDDSMVTMVTDMSDQCKIVESLIQHCDWFFSDDVESQQDVPSDAMRGEKPVKKRMPLAEKAAQEEEEEEEDGEDLMDKTPPLKTSSMEELHIDVERMFNTKDIIMSVNAAAQRKMKSSSKPFTSPDTPEVKYRRPSPEPQLHTIKLHDQEALKLTVSQAPVTIDLGPARSPDADSGRSGSTPGKVVLRRSSQSSTDSKVGGVSDGSGSPVEMDSLLQGSLFGSTNRSYHPRAYYQNFQFGSTRGRKLSESSDSGSPVNLERELKSLTSATSRTEGWVQSDYSKERERVERQHQEALRDLEKEDSTNIEELFHARDFRSELSAMSNKIMDYTKKGVESPTTGRKQPLEKSVVTAHSKSSNNNNAFASACDSKTDSPKKQTSSDRGSRLGSPLHIDEKDIESDFLQSMKATFEERLQRVLQHESEDDASRPTSLVGDKDPSSPAHSHGEESRGIHYRSNSVDRSEALRRRLDSPKKEISSSSSPHSGSPRSSRDISKSPSRSSKSSSPSHSPKKCSRIEVILTMEKRETTPATLRDNITNKAQEVGKSPKASSKDTASLRDKQREKRRRRHTVGGKDFKDFQKAITEHFFPKGDSQKMSAVDRLKPFGKENVKSPAKKPQDIKSWLETERQRSTTSSPNLLSTVQASIARLHPMETEKQRREKELRRKSTPILGTTDFNNDTQPHKLSRMPRYFEIESYL
ncbi:rho GTPase-activating protein 21-like isoform X2 [Diadema antillarum]|uniref:rho GTPase-activating protein 21-like isoform X2 n=1 Tax=Diadema antillarum TaxID=105358 RepID=UPI003A899345